MKQRTHGEGWVNFGFFAMIVVLWTILMSALMRTDWTPHHVDGPGLPSHERKQAHAGSGEE